MATRKSSLFYGVLIAISSLVVGMVIASRLDLTPLSGAANGPLAIPATNSDPLTGQIDATTFRNIARIAGPAVVSIRATTMQRVQSTDTLREFFGLPLPSVPGQGRDGGEPREVPQTGAGSGFIIDKNGYILTNNHVVEGATEIRIRLSTMHESEEGLKARIVGRDELTDTALLQIEEMPSAELPVMRFGDSTQMAPGDWVMAIGNPFNLSNTVTVGIVSAVGRPNEVAQGRSADFIQTDAAINRGNSGGPLLNIRGEVIGINTMILTNQMGGGNVGIGFAIPINTVRDLLPQLREGKVTRGRIGVEIFGTPINAEYSKELNLPHVGGAEVSRVPTGGPADRAGVEPGDVIVEFNGRPVKNRDELVATVVSTRPGTTVPVKIIRDKQEQMVSLTVDELNLENEGARAAEPRAAVEPDEEPSQGFGITLSALTPDAARRLRAADAQGVLVSDVEQGSPAFRAGIARGDIITHVNRQPVRTPQEASRALGQVASGSTAFLLVLRNGQEQFFTIRKE